MISKKLIMIILAIPILIFNSCSKEEDSAPTATPEVLSNEYEGFLKLRFTNTFPSFDETTQVDVHIYKTGDVTFGTGTLSYNAEEDNGQSKIRRVGTLTLKPNGHHFDNNGEYYVDVKENTAVNETMTVWYWNPQNQTWVQAVNENITDTWNGGLVFSMDNAVINGSFVQSSSSGGSVTWSLHLVVIP